jgi:hypothetical protein
MDLQGGTAIRLDGYKVRNIIFRNSKIIYKGGPLEMQNVYFVDCTFDFQLTPNSRSLSNRILAFAPTDFSVG